MSQVEVFEKMLSTGQDNAIDSYTRGIAVAEKKGDKQAMKEMQVFVRKLQRSGG